MPAPATNDELNEVILKSGVIEDARLKNYLKKLGESADGIPAEPSKLAGVMVRDGVLTYFQAEQLLQGKWKRFFIGKYKVLERLGAGGMGQVFLCEHKLMKRRVAVKVLPAAKSQDEAALSRFFREAKAVASVDHPNIVRAYDIDQDENLHFIVMEFVDGANFHDLVKRHGPMDILRACHYIYGATVGLHHAHEMGLVHRDIKPANILVDRSGVVKILDMGLARFSHPEEEDMLTKKFDENVLGTADYLAPEQAMDSSTADIRADIYGLGGTFYYMLTGSALFPEGTVAQKLLWHQTKPPKSVRLIRPEVPEELAAILDRMLAKTPEERFQTPAELMSALAPWVQTPIPPPPDHEMPLLSAAASTGFATRNQGGPSLGSGSGAPLATSPPTVAYSQATPAPFTNEAAVTQPGGRPAARLSSSFPAIPVAASHGATAKPVVATLAPQKKAAVVEAPAVWESLTSETIGNNLADTANAKKKPKVPAKGESTTLEPVKATAKKKGSLLPWIIAAAAGFFIVLVLAGITVYYVTKKDKEDDTTTTTPRVPKKWCVIASGSSPDFDPAQTRKTIKEALDSARNGDTIVILDDRIETPAVAYGNPKQKISLRIEAGNPSKNVTWVYKPGTGSKATIALDLLNLEGSTIEGITFDLGGQIDVGIRIQGQSSGTVFQNSTIRGAKRAGLLAQGIDAADGKPLKLIKLRFSPEKSDKPYETAIDVIGANNLEIVDCRFEGAGKGTALRIEGVANNIEFRNNRVFNFDQGVLIVGAGDKAKGLGMMVANNTFHTMKAAAVNAEAALAPGRNVTLERNLFVKSAEIFKAPLPSPGVKAEQNGMSESKEGGVSLKVENATGINNNTAKPDLGDDFLRGINGARPTIGKDKIPVGFE